jgi:hypothetical protein
MVILFMLLVAAPQIIISKYISAYRIPYYSFLVMYSKTQRLLPTARPS